MSSYDPLPRVGPRLLFLLFVREDERDDGALREFADSIEDFEDPFRNRSDLTLPFSVDLLLDLPFVLELEVGLLYTDLFADESFSLNVNCLLLVDVGDGFILTDPFLLPFD